MDYQSLGPMVSNMKIELLTRKIKCLDTVNKGYQIIRTISAQVGYFYMDNEHRCLDSVMFQNSLICFFFGGKLDKNRIDKQNCLFRYV